MKMKPEDALVLLSTWAADFNFGVVPDNKVIDVINAIVDSMDIHDRYAAKQRALVYWDIDGDAK
jgi:hypothetical protein